ncbi:MAG: hypothetical protein V4574_15765 [Pseudomonadota bacterium]
MRRSAFLSDALAAGLATAVSLALWVRGVRGWDDMLVNGTGEFDLLGIVTLAFKLILVGAAGAVVGAVPLGWIRRRAATRAAAWSYAVVAGLGLLLAIPLGFVQLHPSYITLANFGWPLTALLLGLALSAAFAHRPGVRSVIEILHIVAGVFAAMLIASFAAWSYPLAKHDIWLVAYAAMVAVVAMGLGPIRRAADADRQTIAGVRVAADE